MAGSIAEEEYDEEVLHESPIHSDMFLQLTLLESCKACIIDIDGIQAHGLY